MNLFRAKCNHRAVEQIVGRERIQRACHRQLVRSAVARRRVNSTVIPLRFLKTKTNQRETCRSRMARGSLLVALVDSRKLAALTRFS